MDRQFIVTIKDWKPEQYDDLFVTGLIEDEVGQHFRRVYCKVKKD
jgi:hypothetical protein